MNGEIVKARNLGIGWLISCARPAEERLTPETGQPGGNGQPELRSACGARKEHEASLLIAHKASLRVRCATYRLIRADSRETPASAVRRV